MNSFLTFVFRLEVRHCLPTLYQRHQIHRRRWALLRNAGWNACSSAFLDASKRRSYLVLPTLSSGRVYGGFNLVSPSLILSCSGPHQNLAAVCMVGCGQS
jgi:hypothetical protein